MFLSPSMSQYGSYVNMVYISCWNMDPEFYLCSVLIREHRLGNPLLLGTFSVAFAERFTGLGVSAGSRGWGTFCLYPGIISPHCSFNRAFLTCWVDASVNRERETNKAIYCKVKLQSVRNSLGVMWQGVAEWTPPHPFSGMLNSHSKEEEAACLLVIVKAYYQREEENAKEVYLYKERIR